MPKYIMPKLFSLSDLPEFKEFQAANPENKIDEISSAIMFGRAIHWLSIYKVLWPPFEEIDYYYVEVAYIVHNDPGKSLYPIEFYEQIAQMLSTFWTIQLNDLYPEGDWEVKIWDHSERTVEATIRKR